MTERCDCGKNLPRREALRAFLEECLLDPEAALTYLCGCGMRYELAAGSDVFEVHGPALNPITGRQPEVH